MIFRCGRLRKLTVALLVCVAACCAVQARAQAPARNPAITETLCRTCHADKFATFASNPHTVLQSEAWQERGSPRPVCLNCHRDAEEHISAGGGLGTVFAFRTEPAPQQSEVCLDCHAGTHPGFDRSPHAQSGLGCADCHSMHGATAAVGPLLRQVAERLNPTGRVGSASRLCLDCHQDKLAEFELNERHRLLEGAVECGSCHDPHAPATRSLLGGFKQEQCIDCHTDKGGPFVFEHPAARVEGCTGCHSPHGSPNRHLLEHQRVAELCIGCHASVPQFHLGFNPAAPTRFDLDTQCTNCHSAIHGSNLDPRFLR